jgi:hypothetical protein
MSSAIDLYQHGRWAAEQVDAFLRVAHDAGGSTAGSLKASLLAVAPPSHAPSVSGYLEGLFNPATLSLVFSMDQHTTIAQAALGFMHDQYGVHGESPSLCLPHRVSHCVSLTVSHRVSHCVSHCVSLAVSLTVPLSTVSPSLRLPLSLSHCACLTISLTVSRTASLTVSLTVSPPLLSPSPSPPCASLAVSLTVSPPLCLPGVVTEIGYNADLDMDGDGADDDDTYEDNIFVVRSKNGEFEETPIGGHLPPAAERTLAHVKVRTRPSVLP